MDQVTKAVRIPKEREFQISGMISKVSFEDQQKVSRNNTIIQAAGPSPHHNSWNLRPLVDSTTRQIYSIQKMKNIFPSIFSMPLQIYLLQSLSIKVVGKADSVDIDDHGLAALPPSIFCFSLLLLMLQLNSEPALQNASNLQRSWIEDPKSQAGYYLLAR